MKNNLEQLWKEEARKAYQDQQSQDNEGGCREPIGFVQGYLAAKMSDFEETKTLKEQLAEAVKLAKLGIYSVDGLLTHNHESWELSAESWLFKTKIFLEKQNKENKDEI